MDKKYWYLWAENERGQRTLLLGPFDTREEVDKYCDQAMRQVKKLGYCTGFWQTGGVAFAESKGPGKLNAMAWMEA